MSKGKKSDKAFNLTELSTEHFYVKRLKTDFEKLSKQAVPIVEVSKVKRVAGVSAVAIDFVFSGQQKISLFVRASGDVFKATLNGKAVPLVGDLNYRFDDVYKYSVENLVKHLVEGQSAFDKKQRDAKPIVPKTGNSGGGKVSTVNKIQKLEETEKQLDTQVTEQENKKVLLLQQIELAHLQQPINNTVH